MYAVKTDGKWKTGKVDDGTFVGSANRVALSSDGLPLFGYGHNPSGQLRFAALISGSWVRQVLEEEYYFQSLTDQSIEMGDRPEWRNTSGNGRSQILSYPSSGCILMLNPILLTSGRLSSIR
jgi:hypothetical protein